VRKIWNVKLTRLWRGHTEHLADIKRLFSYLSLNLYFSVSSKYQSSLLLDFSLCCARNIYLTSRNILAILLSRLKCTPPIPSIQVSATSYFPNGKVTQKKATILSKKTKRFQNDHNKRVDYTHSHAQVASCDGPASQQPSQPYTGKFPYLNTSKSTDANAAGHQPSSMSLDHWHKAHSTPTLAGRSVEAHQWRDGKMRAGAALECFRRCMLPW
jgi:hypothetical protein